VTAHSGCHHHQAAQAASGSCKTFSGIAIAIQAFIMFDYTDFMQVFPAGAQLPYGRELQADIESSRKAFDGMLFIDRIMAALGVFKRARNFQAASYISMLTNLRSENLPAQIGQRASTASPADR
jgi:hypothetical protein